MSLTRIYIDTCPLIEVLKHLDGTPLSPEREREVWFTQRCLEAGLHGEIELITSTLTIAELRGTSIRPIPAETKRIIHSVLTSGRVMQLSMITQGITELARDLDWDHGINLGGADAIHVATALTLKCTEFLTLDGKPLKNTGQIAGLGLRVILPSQTTELPPNYRQGKLKLDSSKTKSLLLKT